MCISYGTQVTVKSCSLLFLIPVFLIQISVSSSDSCEVSRSTVQFVDSCPDSEEKWKKAAARKNCSAYANLCDEPERLVYHCVINEYVSQTLEVCAYRRLIFLGKKIIQLIFNFVYPPPHNPVIFTILRKK